MGQKQEKLSYWGFWWLLFRVKCATISDFLRNCCTYYRKKPRFALADLLQLCWYFFCSPYRIARMWAKKYPEAEPYGETSLVTMECIARAAEISASDVVFDLGCGRGRSCFWLAAYVGCRVVGIECIPLFCRRAAKIAEWLSFKNIEFRCEDMVKSSFQGATVLYLYGSQLGDPFLTKISKKMAQLPRGTKIISVSYPLTEYFPLHRLQITKTLEARFLWGSTDVYIQEIT